MSVQPLKLSVARRFGRGAALALRYLMALFFLGAAWNKWSKGWLWSDQLQRIFVERIGEIDPESFGAWFLENVGLPYWKPLAWYVTVGETLIAFGLLFGLMSRWAAFAAMLMMFSFAIGGYYDASLIALGLMFLPLILLPTGHWLGLDRRLHAHYPHSIWFR
jgi:thiosulfate dehydrogenase [quinone] large subunit